MTDTEYIKSELTLPPGFADAVLDPRITAAIESPFPFNPDDSDAELDLGDDLANTPLAPVVPECVECDFRPTPLFSSVADICTCCGRTREDSPL